MNENKVEKEVIERNKELVERYPFLLPRNVFTDKVIPDYDYEFTEYDNIATGWRIAFGELLLEDLRETLVKTDYLDSFRFLQIKEKYGSLRLYTNGAPEEVYDVLQKYEFISECICIKCGSPHACIVDDYGWYLPLCEECWNNSNKWREEKGYKVKSYKEAANGNLYELPDSYTITRYSHGLYTDIVYDISDVSQKIREAYEIRKGNKC
jgi:hypothetical protein